MTDSECLVYVDSSSRGEWAVTAAAQLVPNVVPRAMLLATKEDVAAAPDLLVKAAAALPPGSTRQLVLPGPAERAVQEAASRVRYALVVVPPAGRKAIARLIKGSRVATVVREVKASVLVARRPPPAFRRLLLAVGGGVHSAATALGAIEVAKALGADLHVLHVDSGVELPSELPWTLKRPPSEKVAQRIDRAASLDGVKKALDAAGYGASIRTRNGTIVGEVLAEVEEGAHDLLVLGAHRAAGAARWVLDDVTEQILLGCPVSILVIRAPEP
jgi:nucleotide-binding universal stress UspA family protein